MHSFVRVATLATLLALAAAAAGARRSDQDFEFDDDAESGVTSVANGGHSRRPRRYVYDPHNSLCRSLVCKKREVCVLRDAFTALCATKKDILRRGDIIVAASSGGGWDGEAREGGGAAGAGGAAEWERDDNDDDVFYDASARDSDADPDLDADDAKRCVGCGGRTRAQFLCGSDNRTYSSLCRLDLHNCVRRGARPVRLACRGFCPCARPRRRPRPHRRPADEDTDWRRRKSESSHNEVLPERQSRRRLAQGSEGCALDKMANRLLDWFSVLMDEAGATAPPTDGFPRDCKPEVRWMFAHLDTDGDGLLSATNLYALRHDERERCLRRARLLPAAPVPRRAGRVLVRGRARPGAARLAHQGRPGLSWREGRGGRGGRAGRRRGRRRQRGRGAALLAARGSPPAPHRYTTFRLLHVTVSYSPKHMICWKKPTCYIYHKTLSPLATLRKITYLVLFIMCLHNLFSPAHMEMKSTC